MLWASWWPSQSEKLLVLFKLPAKDFNTHLGKASNYQGIKSGYLIISGHSAVGRALSCKPWGRGFESWASQCAIWQTPVLLVDGAVKQSVATVHCSPRYIRALNQLLSRECMVITKKCIIKSQSLLFLWSSEILPPQNITSWGRNVDNFVKSNLQTEWAKKAEIPRIWGMVEATNKMRKLVRPIQYCNLMQHYRSRWMKMN